MGDLRGAKRLDALLRRHTMAPFLSAVRCATTQDRLHITGGQSKRSSCCVQFLGSTKMRATCCQHLTQAATARPQLAAPSPSSRSLFPGNDRDHARRVQCPNTAKHHRSRSNLRPTNPYIYSSYTGWLLATMLKTCIHASYLTLFDQAQ